jgi:hypothetical protein
MALYRLDHWCEAPARQQDRDLPGQSLDQRLRVGHGMDMVLGHDLLRRVFKANRRQPVRVRLRPTLFAGIEPAVPQPEPLQMLQHLARNAPRRCPRKDQITHRLVGRIPHPDRRQLSRPVQLCQHEGTRAGRSLPGRPPSPERARAR